MATNEIFLHTLDTIPLEKIVREEYRNYQIYTLMDRAIPYLRDGLKPVQRRILYTLWKNQSKGLMKVSSATGLVLTLHPHGPASIEASIVNMAQDYAFSNNYPMIDKKGYFGERMEPVAAASRYIECKLGKVAELLLFDDMNQVEMVPNYDERSVEPLSLKPKLPIMLLNGSEGIGTGFSSTIPAYNHKDIIKSMIQYVETGKAKKIKPFVRYFSRPIIEDKGKFIFKAEYEKRGSDITMVEAPRGYDAQRLYKFLNKYIEKDFIKDYIDSSVDNTIQVELVFKRGAEVSLEEVQKEMSISTSMAPNFTLIGDHGVRIFDGPEDIISIFTEQRIEIVQKRYDLWAQDAGERIKQNNEIIRFIKERHYAQAEKQSNRKSFVEYLSKQKFVYADYLADMAIYRMTKDEVAKRVLLVEEDTKKLKEFTNISKSDALVRKKLIEELQEVDEGLTKIMRLKEEEKKKSARKPTKRKTSRSR